MEKIESVIFDFKKISGLPAVFLPCDPKGNFDFESCRHLFPPICGRLRASKAGCRYCESKHEYLRSMMTAKRDCANIICSIGLHEMHVPVYDGDDLKGIIAVICCSDKLADELSRGDDDLYRKRYQMSLAELLEELREIPVIPTEKIPTVTDLLSSLVQLNFSVYHPLRLSSEYPEHPSSQTAARTAGIPLSEFFALHSNDPVFYQARYDLVRNNLQMMILFLRTMKLKEAKEIFFQIFQNAFAEKSQESRQFSSILTLYLCFTDLVGMLPSNDRLYEYTKECARNIDDSDDIYAIRFSLDNYFSGLIELCSIPEKTYQPIVIQIVHYIEQHYQRPFTISEMDRTLHVSDSYARKVFYEYMGTSIKTYINLVRMYKAQYLIKTTDLHISQIAQMVGYSDTRVFYKMYNKYYSIPCSYLRTLGTETATARSADENFMTLHMPG